MSGLFIVQNKLTAIREQIWRLQAQEEVLVELLDGETEVALEVVPTVNAEHEQPPGLAVEETKKKPRKRRHGDWTEEEDEALRSTYPEGGIAASREALPGRSDMAIRYRASTFGLKCGRQLAGRNTWSDEEVAILREFYPQTGIDVMAKLPGRTEAAIRKHAFDLKIKMLPKPKKAKPEKRAKAVDVPRKSATPAKATTCLTAKTVPSQPEPPSFAEQLARVERGEVGIAPAFHPHRADPGMTLGGVVGEIN